MSNLLQEMSEWVAGLSLDDVPDRVVRSARNQLYSVLGATYAGTYYDKSANLIRAVEKWSSEGNAPVFGFDQRLDPMGAVFANSALACAHDYDDYLFLGHSGHSAVHVPLAYGAALGKTLEDVLVAQIAANEVEGRLGATVHLGPQNGQLWTHIHTLGAVVSAGKLKDLSAEEIAHAIAIAFYQPMMALWPGFIGGDSKLASASSPAVHGLMAVEMAEEGLTGNPEMLEHPQGFMAAFSYKPFPRFLTGWGKSWVSDTLAFKLFPGCAYIDTALDALGMIDQSFQEKHGRPLEESDIGKIEVETSMLSTAMEKLFRKENAEAVTSIGINFSIKLSMALRIVHGRLDVEDFQNESLSSHESRIREIEHKVTIRHNWDHTIAFVRHFIEAVNYFSAARHIKAGDVVDIRRRAKTQFNESAEFDWKDIRAMFSHLPPDMRQGLWKAAKRAMKVGYRSPTRGPYDLGDLDFEKVTLPFAADVRLITSNGETFEASQRIPFGAAGHPPESIQQDVTQKFLYEAGRKIGAKKAKRAVDWLEKEDLDRPITDWLEMLG